jgi:glutamate synthase domain-containing protein 2
LNTYPVGIATQDPVQREKFAGQPEQAINYFFLLAKEVRKEMAKLGLVKFQQLIGRTNFVRARDAQDPTSPKKSKTFVLWRRST